MKLSPLKARTGCCCLVGRAQALLHFGVQGSVLVVVEDLHFLAGVGFRHQVKGLYWVTTAVELIVGNCTRQVCHSCRIDRLVVVVVA